MGHVDTSGVTHILSIFTSESKKINLENKENLDSRKIKSEIIESINSLKEL